MPLNPMYASGVMAHTKERAALMNNGGCGPAELPGDGPPEDFQPPPTPFGQITKAEMLAIVKEQALSKQKRKEVPARTFQESLKFYATFSFSLIAITGFSVLMFLVPFIVDPALATLTADFVDKPVECRVIFSRAILGLSNCSWSSCREGCTRDIFSCHHILVEYTFLQADYRLMSLMREQQGILEQAPTKHKAVLFVNVKGCGYPPSVNCTTWIREFGRLDSTFPCYYARSNQSLAITHLDTATDLRDLLMSTTIPLTACLVSGIALCLMHTSCLHSICSFRRRSRHRDYKSVKVEPEPQICDGFSVRRSNNGTGAGGAKPPRSILTSRTEERPPPASGSKGEKSKLRKRLSFQHSSAAGTFKRKADLLELPALSKKVKIESDDCDSLFSSTENLLDLELDPVQDCM